MPTQAPQTMITDQDAAIAKAISMVMPFTFHRYCFWHILNKFFEKINVMVYNDEYHMLVDDGGNIGSTRTKTTTREDSLTIQDPSAIRAKGCGKRLKSSKEKSMSKQNRQCRICGQHGHDKRTTPNRNEMSNTDMDQHGNDPDATTQYDGRDDKTFTSQASSHYDTVNWFL
ncbi:Protein FAR1-RELATED SEQUENCE [Abeliophyllum distichum]|uniref:Protein FAR1-RELATED SEQUENCE n=1 Tax=Abeliophyllum distichum TaxID=126358 RepID=A0ABD1Q7K2_9LAMI